MLTMMLPGRGARHVPLGVLCTALLLAPTALPAQKPAPARGPQALRELSDAFQDVARKVSPAVVKILVSGYGPVEEDGVEKTAVIGRQHSIGSGVIVDPKGYIVTNAHVVKGAEQIRVVLPIRPEGRPTSRARARILKGTLAGVDADTDLAVIKVDAADLPAVSIGDYRKVQQGEVVLAFGSPEGLEDSVTMGVVSSVMRQPDPDRPDIYIQTDAAINPGNSGGPLVDVDGHLLGINTFILSESGGNEGIGFAIPSVVVRFVYQEILAHGHVHRRQMGLHLQTVTPAIAAGLGLPEEAALIVGDILPDGPAGTAGMKVGDIVTGVDGAPVESLPAFMTALYRKGHGDSAMLSVLRGSDHMQFKVPVVEQQQQEFDDLAGLANVERSGVAQLGILGIEITPKIADMISDLRIPSGVIVAAKAAGAMVDVGLAPGDVIHSLNGTVITSLDALRAGLGRLKPGDAVVLQVERDGRLAFVAFDLD